MSGSEPAPLNEFDSSLELRSRAMAWVIGTLVVALVFLVWILPRFGIRLLPGNLPSWAPLGMLLLLWVLEVRVLALLRRGAKAAARPGLELLVSVTEVTAVSGVLALAAGYVEPPVVVLFSPGAWLYFPLIGVATLTLRPMIVATTGILSAVQYALLAWWLVPRSIPGSDLPQVFFSPGLHIDKAIVLLATTAVGAAVCWDLRRRMKRVVRAARERQHIIDLFGQQTAPEVVDALLDSGGEVVPERREVGILFLDIRGFTGEAERTPPEEVVARLDAFFERVIPKVTENGGIVHQLLGDGLMAIFGAPVAHEDDARRALRTAIEIADLLENSVAAGQLRPTEVVMGVHFGEVVAGPVGSRDHKEYKVTGDAVNVAARLETLAKERGATILSSRRAVEAAGYGVEAFEDLGCVTIRGRAAELGLVKVR